MSEPRDEREAAIAAALASLEPVLQRIAERASERVVGMTNVSAIEVALREETVSAFRDYYLDAAVRDALDAMDTLSGRED